MNRVLDIECQGPAGVGTAHITGMLLWAHSSTHVVNTREVGPIPVVRHERKGRSNKRLRIALVDR